jgi:hypothetical protein
MSSDRRYALLKHDHDGTDLGVVYGSATANTLPTLGRHNNATSLSLRFRGDPRYGLTAGVLGSGNGFIQAHRADGTATAYDLQLQPLGGSTIVAGVLYGRSNAYFESAAGNKGYINIIQGDSTKPGYLEFMHYDATRRGYFGWNDGASRLMWAAEGTWGLTLASAADISISASSHIDLFSTSKCVRITGSGDAWSSSSWARALSLRSESAAIQFYGSTLSWGIGNSYGVFYIMHTTSDTSAAPGMSYPVYMNTTDINIGYKTTFANHISVPSGYAYYLNGMSGAKYMADAAGTSSYGSLRIGGHTGSYGGIRDDYSGVSCIFDSAGNGGWYREATVGWMSYYSQTNTCWAYGTATTTSSSYEIYVTGSAYASGTWTASDARKKENVHTIPYALHTVSKLRGVSYNWKADAGVGQDPTKRHIGLLAQEVQAVVPEAVLYAEDADSYAVDYGGLIGLLIEAVKELREKYEQTH